MTSRRTFPWLMMVTLILVLIAVAVAMAPAGMQVMCVDSDDPSRSGCESWRVSALGITTSWVAWGVLSALAVVVIAGGWMLRRQIARD